MDIESRILDLAFCQIAPSRILSDLKQKLSNTSLSFASNLASNDDTFLSFAETVLSEYSEDEQRLLLQKTKQDIQYFAIQYNLYPSTLLLPVCFSEKTLSLNAQTPVCRLDYTLKWREIYLRLGQDMFVCAYLAFHDLIDCRERNSFAWPAIIHTDDPTLNHVLEQGLAENHCHLNGSTQSFSVSWSRFMNDINGSEKELSKFSERLYSKLSRGPQDDLESIGEEVRLAAHIRSILFRAIDRHEWQKSNPSNGMKEEYSGDTAFQEEYLFSSYPQNVAASRIDILRFMYGKTFEMPDGKRVCLDYAIHKGLSEVDDQSPYRLLVGERFFMYACFKNCMNKDFSPIERELFYLYLLLKTNFRGELIQVNDQIGFKNFANYQDRKDIAWERNSYWWEAIRMAICAPIKQDHVCSLEARIGTASSVKEYKKRVCLLDEVKYYDDFGTAFLPQRIRTAEIFQGINQPHFFVFHFAKRKDQLNALRDGRVFFCRHWNLREKVRMQAMALAEVLGRSTYMCTRIRGIDACSNEIGCRPETFATEFRFLRGFNPRLYIEGHSLWEPYALPKISITYHAGEDFLDLADGLRAIDEAVSFLGFQRGDRIGHALALGVEPELHYRRKRKEIITTKQDRLDDLVWLLYRSLDYDITINAMLEQRMRTEAQGLLIELYGSAISRNGWNITLWDYYCSMQLRGDAPDLYISGCFVNSARTLLQYNQFKVNHANGNLQSFRENNILTKLYYYYEYGYEARKTGSEVICVSVEEDYLNLIDAMQKAMQVDLEAKGIVIECNPSSNVLIGSFKEYRNHPIFRFNDNGLGITRERSAKMHTCINTDDLGVFDTSLEFEYALVYQTLRELHNGSNHPMISSQDGLDYIRNLQRLGKLAVFPKVSLIEP